MIPDTPQVRAAAEAVATVLADNPLDALLVRWSRVPWRIVVVGRVGVGKTTLVQRLGGDSVGEVGLGGVTRDPRVARVGGVEVIDTPGIDDPDVAALDLVPLLADADAVLWVVDGLMPAGATERRVLESTDAVLRVVIGRLDLVEPTDRDAVIARVRGIVDERGGGEVRAGDVRTLDVAGLLDVPAAGSPRRQRALTAALKAAEGAITALPPAPSRQVLQDVARTAWHRVVRETEAIVADEIARGVVDQREQAERRLRLLAPIRMPEFHAAWVHLLPGVPPPEMPIPPAVPPSLPLMAAVSGGAEGASRGLRAAAGRWAGEGDLALLDHLGAIELPDRETPRRAALLAVQAAREPRLQ